MIVCGSYMHGISVSKDMGEKKITMIKGERRW
jgi:hypothetical protein